MLRPGGGTCVIDRWRSDYCGQRNRVNERWREREGEEVRNMEQMHGRGGEAHTHAYVHLAHIHTHTHTHTHTQSNNTLHTAGSLQGLPLPYEDWQ